MERSLISNFSRIIDPENESNSVKPKVSYVYGKVTNILDDGQTVRVKIDGSEVECPMKSNVTVEKGHRVMIMLRNHEGTIVNNVSTPATTVDFLKSDDGKTIIEDQAKDSMDELETKIKSSIDDAIQSWLNKMFPLGSIIITTTKISPASIYNGQWQLIGEGLTLMSVTEDDEGGSIPGGIYDSNIRTVDGVPAHTHSVSGAGTIDTSSNGSHTHRMRMYPTLREGSIFGTDTRNFGIGKDLDGFRNRVMVQASTDLTPAQEESAFYPTEVSANHTHKVDLSNITIGSSGSGGTVDVTPRHLTVYMWRRIS